MGDFEEIVLGKQERGKKSGLVIALVTFAVYFALYDGPAAGSWDTAIAVPSSLIAGVSVASADPTAPAGTLSADLINPSGEIMPGGLSTLWAAAIAAPFFRLFNVFGLRLFHAMIPALTALVFFGLVHRLTSRRWLGFLASAALVLNPFVLSFQRLNPNFPAMLMISALFLMLETPPLRPLFAGLLLGALAAVKSEAVVFIPIVLLWTHRKAFDEAAGKKTRERKLVAAGAAGWLLLGALVLSLPLLYWQHLNVGLLPTESALPGTPAAAGGSFRHEILGIPFGMDGMLSFPFAEAVVRTPHFPQPVFLLIPLVMLRCFGLVLGSLAILGIPASHAANRSLSWRLLLWIALAVLVLSFQENWEELKMSNVMLLLPPLVLLMAFGLQAVANFTLIGRSAVTIAVSAVLLAAFLKSSFYLEFPADSRWYHRFPKAAENSSGLDGLPRDKRLGPEFFVTRETEKENLIEKSRLSQACVLPCEYFPIDWCPEDALVRAASELQTRRLTVKSYISADR